MVDDGIYVKNADIVARAGDGADTTAVSTAETDKYVLTVEAYINAYTRFDWSTAWGTLTANLKGILTDIGACMCAMYVIQRNMDGYASLLTAQTMLDVLDNRYKQGLKRIMESDQVKKAMGKP